MGTLRVIRAIMRMRAAQWLQEARQLEQAADALDQETAPQTTTQAALLRHKAAWLRLGSAVFE